MKKPAHTDTGEATTASSERRQVCAGREEEAEAAKEQALSAGRVPRAKGSDGRKDCARLLRSKRREILPVHSKGRMHTLGIPENVHGAQLRQRQRLSETACQSGAVSDSDVPDRQRCGVSQRASGHQVQAQNPV